MSVLPAYAYRAFGSFGLAVSPWAARAQEVVPGASSQSPVGAAYANLVELDRLLAEDQKRDQQGNSKLSPCPSAAQARAAIFLFPGQPRPGQVVRVVAISWSRSQLGYLSVRVNSQPLPVTGARGFSGPPYSLEARVLPTTAGRMRVRLSHRNTGYATACATHAVDGDRPPARAAASRAVWPVTRSWDRWSEALFSAWVARLFHVPRGGQGGWFPLHQATRDSSRNWLHNSLGRAEDSAAAATKVILMPDCGDTPYFLRAYFAWKLGLPFSFQRCTRGNAVTGPICPFPRDNLTARYARIGNPVARFNAFAREWIGWGVHSGTTRTLAADDRADFYPVALTQRALRPGRIFVDPAGHVFVLSQQHRGNRRQLGVLFGIDGHPDRTISRKRFSKGTFVFDARVKTGGFKAFRPLVYEHGRIRQLTNAEIGRHPDFGDFALEQTQLASSQAFYDAVHRAMNPHPVLPTQLYRSKILALYEAVLERVKAVDVGVAFMQRNHWKQVHIPSGPAIFETNGLWEVYSTPARDLRLLMAVQDVLDFPQDVLKRRHLYRIPAGWGRTQLLGALDAVYRNLTSTLGLSYVRSDQQLQQLTLADIIARREALRMAYNPNDCSEVRWGAPPVSDERKSCRRRAQQAQQDSMRRYRVWFQLLKRPALRG
ncbi:MAG: hypothetical protein ABI333_00970 [bacterium]